jgi:hypothetical protein
MSAKSHKPTSRPSIRMSALGSKADILTSDKAYYRKQSTCSGGRSEPPSGPRLLFLPRAHSNSACSLLLSHPVGQLVYVTRRLTMLDHEELDEAAQVRQVRFLCRRQRILASTKGAGRNRRPLLRNVRKRRCGYGFFSAHALVAASHVPPAFVQSASVFAAAAPAKAGPVKASARVIANIEMRIFMAFSPLRWTKPQYLNALFETYVPGTPDPIAG